MLIYWRILRIPWPSMKETNKFLKNGSRKKTAANDQQTTVENCKHNIGMKPW